MKTGDIQFKRGVKMPSKNKLLLMRLGFCAAYPPRVLKASTMKRVSLTPLFLALCSPDRDRGQCAPLLGRLPKHTALSSWVIDLSAWGKLKVTFQISFLEKATFKHFLKKKNYILSYIKRKKYSFIDSVCYMPIRRS